MKKQMSGRHIFRLIIITIILTSPFNTYANQNDKPVKTVSLEEAISDISLKDPNILESLKTYSSVLAERAIAKSGYYPTVGTTISSGPERTDGVETGDIEKNLIATDASLYVRQNIFKGGETTAFVNETEARIRAAAYDVLNTANDVYLETAQAYINVIKARDLLAIAEQNSLTQEKIMLQVREKTEAGFNRVSELYNSESRLALSKGSFISRQQDLNQALVVFHKRFGQQLSPEQFVIPQPKAQLPPTVEEAVDLAFHTHPALKVAAFNIESSRYAFERSDAKDYPTLDLELRGQYRDDTGGDEGDTTQLGAYLMFNYTFYDGGLRDGEQQRDRQRIRKENQRSYIERRNVNESVRLAWNIKEAEDYKKKYLNEHVQLSAKTLDAFKEEYYVGKRTLLDLLNMENEYTDAKLSYSESQFSHLIAQYRLLQSTGILLKEYNSGLRQKLELPPENYADVFDTIKKQEVKAYEGISVNRDEDSSMDKVDQCDNSSFTAKIKINGCVEIKVTALGYSHDNETLGPYINPQQFEDKAYPLSKIQDSKALSPDKIHLETQPNTGALTQDAVANLSEFTLGLFSREYKGKILVEGFVASNNNTQENTQLSLKRANMVKELLIADGIDAFAITVEGKGNQNPIGDNSTAAGRRLNRRVEVSLTK